MRAADPRRARRRDDRATVVARSSAFRDIYRELVEIDTTDTTGDTLKAAEAMAARLKAGGFPAADIRVVSTGPRKGNLVARLRGTGARKPMLLLAHIDVVPPGDGWQHDPFRLVEADGYFHGRGVIDDKAMAAIFVANLIEYHHEGFRPERDIIVALTTDEELAHSPHNGVRGCWSNERALIDAEFAHQRGRRRRAAQRHAVPARRFSSPRRSTRPTCWR